MKVVDKRKKLYKQVRDGKKKQRSGKRRESTEKEGKRK